MTTLEATLHAKELELEKLTIRRIKLELMDSDDDEHENINIMATIVEMDIKMEKLKKAIDILASTIQTLHYKHATVSPTSVRSPNFALGPTLSTPQESPSNLPGPSARLPLQPTVSNDMDSAGEDSDILKSPHYTTHTPYSGTLHQRSRVSEEKSARLPADLPRFRGSTTISIQDPEDFLESYQDVMLANSYPMARWATALVPRLELEDRSWLKGVLDEIQPGEWESIRTAFLAHFSHPNQLTKRIQEYEHIRMQPKESMQRYADRFTTVVHKAGIRLDTLQVAIKFKDSLPEYFRDRLETAELASGYHLSTPKLISIAIT